MNRLCILVTAFALTFAAVAATAADRTVVPKGYEKWEKSRQKLITDKKSLFYGSHYIYADKKAFSTYRKGGKFPEGSRFVVVNHSIKEVAGTLVEGKKSMIVMMEKNRKYKDTGGWLFAGFTPEGRPAGLDPVKNCFECHLKDASDRDFVISTFKDFR